METEWRCDGWRVTGDGWRSDEWRVTERRSDGVSGNGGNGGNIGGRFGRDGMRFVLNGKGMEWNMVHDRWGLCTLSPDLIGTDRNWSELVGIRSEFFRPQMAEIWPNFSNQILISSDRTEFNINYFLFNLLKKWHYQGLTYSLNSRGITTLLNSHI